MRNAEAILDIIHERGKNGSDLEDVYRQLYNPDLYLKAYGRIYRNDGAMTPGTTTETVDGMSMGKIAKIIGLLRNERYQWTPVRRTYIPKSSGKMRPLGIPTWSDKLLQEVMRTILDAYYEPQFSTMSHGFRPERGCHTALKDIYHGWTGTKWFIEGDIKGCFDNIDHTILLSILREKIHDNRFLTLVDKLLKAGYCEEWKYRPTLSGTPQGGVISPILSNIYLDQLDKFVEKTFIPQYTRGKKKRRVTAYSRLHSQLCRSRKKGDNTRCKILLKALRYLSTVDQFDPNYRRLRYIRYADDFLLGFDGPKNEAEEIKNQLREFLRDHLKLELSPEKTLITHARTEKARFLGYHISTWNKPGLQGHGNITLRIPSQVIMDKTSRYKVHGKPIHRTELIEDSDFSIIEKYGSEYRGYVQYYAYADNIGWLSYLQWVMRTSLLKTLARKYQSTVTKMAKLYTGKTIDGLNYIRLIVPREGKPPLMARFGGINLKTRPFAMIEDLPTNQDRIPTRSELETRLKADVCEICGSTRNVQVHHVRKLADLKIKGQKEPPLWKQIMASRRRKTLMVCEECHADIHAGRPTRTRDDFPG